MFKKLKALFESKIVRADPLPVYRPTRLLPPRPLPSPRSLPPPERPPLDEFDLESSAQDKMEDQAEETLSSTPFPDNEAPQAKPEETNEKQPIIQELPLDLEPVPSDKATNEDTPATEPPPEAEAQGEAESNPDFEAKVETPAVEATPPEAEPLAPAEAEPASDAAPDNPVEEKSGSEPAAELPLLPVESDETVAPESLANSMPEIEASAPPVEAPAPVAEPPMAAEIAPPPEIAPPVPIPVAAPAPSSSNGGPTSPTSFLPKVQSSARPTPPPVKKHNMLTPTPVGLTPEQLCGVTPNMSPEQVRQRLAFLYRRYNHASSSLNAGLRAEAETALNAIVAVREKHFGPV